MPAIRSADRSSARESWAEFIPGLFALITAATPAAWGAALLVPESPMMKKPVWHWGIWRLNREQAAQTGEAAEFAAASYGVPLDSAKGL